MSGQGIGQIVVYVGRPDRARLPARPLHGPGLHGASAAAARSLERGFLPPRRRDARASRTGSATRRRCSSSASLFSAVLYAIQRLQGHLFLNPDHLKGVPPHIALNTTASFVTNTNWQYYGGEYTMSYLTQMAGLAVQNFVSAARRHGGARRGRARPRAALARASSATSGATSTGRSSTSCCRSSLILARDPDLAGRRRRRSTAHATATTLQGAHADDRARPGRLAGSRSSSSARTAAASTTRTRPSRSRTRTASRTSSRCSRSC